MERSANSGYKKRRRGLFGRSSERRNQSGNHAGADEGTLRAPHLGIGRRHIFAEYGLPPGAILTVKDPRRGVKNRAAETEVSRSARAMVPDASDLASAETVRPTQATTASAAETSQSAQALPPEILDSSEAGIPPVSGKTDFDVFDLPPKLAQALRQAGFVRCAEVQRKILPQSLVARDVLVQAGCGSGRGLALAISMFARRLKRLSAEGPQPGRPWALILADEEGRAAHLEAIIRRLASFMSFQILNLSLGREDVLSSMKKRVDVVIGIPETVIDLLEHNSLDPSRIEFLGIDGVDQMLSQGLAPALRYIAKDMPRKASRQTLLLSSVVDRGTVRLAEDLAYRPIRVLIDPQKAALDTVIHTSYLAADDEKTRVLGNLIMTQSLEQVLLFVNRPADAVQLAQALQQAGLHCGFLREDMSAADVQQELVDFQEGRKPVLATTDKLSRDLRIENVRHLIHYNLPGDPALYAARVLRIAEDDAPGRSICFACREDGARIPAIEKMLGRELESVALPEFLLAPLPRDAKESKVWACGQAEEESEFF